MNYPLCLWPSSLGSQCEVGLEKVPEGQAHGPAPWAPGHWPLQGQEERLRTGVMRWWACAEHPLGVGHGVGVMGVRMRRKGTGGGEKRAQKQQGPRSPGGRGEERTRRGLGFIMVMTTMIAFYYDCHPHD